MNFDITVVIPSFNEERIIQNTLTSFTKESNNRILIVCVDNASNDNTTEQIGLWHKAHPKQALVLLHEKNKGTIYARTKGLEFAKTQSSIVISTDADCRPMTGFYDNLMKFSRNTSKDILIGRQQHNPQVRLLKQIYLPRLMKAVAWMEQLETQLFGPFFFGGYFAIKSEKITPQIFSTNNIAIPDEPTIFWSKHCFYSGYTFEYSDKNLHSSSRRLWSNPSSFISLKHSLPIRNDSVQLQKKIHVLQTLQKKESEHVHKREEFFSKRVLLLLLDAVFFETTLDEKKIVSDVIERACVFIRAKPNSIRNLSNGPFQEAKKRILNNYYKQTISQLRALRKFNNL